MPRPKVKPNFLNARFVVLPVPYEKTVSYKKGTKKGPQAILAASKEVERYDHEIQGNPYRLGVHTLAPLRINLSSYEKTHNQIERAVSDILQSPPLAGQAGRIPILLGGEHSITQGAVRACAKRYKNLSVLQIDAHTDLRDSYTGTKYSHACVMRRILEFCPAVQVGIRNISEEEMEYAKKSGQINNIHWAEKPIQTDTVLSQLSDTVYVTIDVDGFDPSIMPSTGTPEPGGLDWYKVLDLLKAVFRSKKVVGFDLVELAPIAGLHAPDFLCAKLIYKMMGYYFKKA